MLCLAHDMLGDALISSAVLELNASDDRGIDIIRNKIKSFAQTKVTLPIGKQKLIILDEADSITPAAQQALRRTMEIYANTTRFALACNLPSKIIEPIQSRCATLKYAKPSDQDILKRILFIAREEHVQYDEQGLEALLFTAQGDLRQAINNLQATHYGFGMVSAVNVYRVCDTPHPRIIQTMLHACSNQHIDKACEQVKQLWDLGYSAVDIITTIFRIAKNLDQDVQDIPWSQELQLEFIKVRLYLFFLVSLECFFGFFVGDCVYSYARVGRGWKLDAVVWIDGKVMSCCRGGESKPWKISLMGVFFFA